MVQDDPDKAGMPILCPNPPVWHGRWRDNSGKWWPRIDSCDENADGLIAVRRIRSSQSTSLEPVSHAPLDRLYDHLDPETG